MKKLVWILLFATFSSTFGQSSLEAIPRRKRVPSPIDSKIFLGDWWDYYNRAIHRINEGDYRGAEADLREAIKFRPDDARRARTYGVRFQEYYPHAELGAILFDTARYKEAISELTLANQSAPLTENNFFIHESRRQIALAEGTDRQDPALQLIEPPPGLVTNKTTIRLAGQASDDIYVDRILINDIPVLLDKAKSQVAFSQEIPLPRQNNKIIIRVEDLVGRVQTQELMVEVDRQGPVLSLTKVTLESANRARIVGAVYDRAEIGKVAVEGSEVSLTGGTTQSLDLVVPMREGSDTLQLAMADGFGNETLVDLNPRMRTGSLGKRPGQVQVAAVGFNPQWLQGAANSGPVIDVSGLKSLQKVFTEEFYLDGQVKDSQGVESVVVNQERLDLPTGQTDLYFSRIVGPLNEGQNDIQILARNSQGAESSRELKLEFDNPLAIEVEAKLAVAIPDFELVGNLTDDALLNDFQFYFEKTVYDRDRFRVLESDGRALTEVMKERAVAVSEQSDTRYRAGDRTLIAADLVLDGQFEERPGALLARLKVVSVQDPSAPAPLLEVYSVNKSRDSIQQMAEGLYYKLHQEYPMVDGRVILLEPQILADLTSDQKIRRGNQVIAFRREPPFTAPNGRVYPGPATPLGPLSVLTVGREYSQLMPESDLQIQLEDLVVTR